VLQAKLFDGSPIWLLTKMDDVKEVLKDNRFSKVRALHASIIEM
jgi:cytochrome P450